MAVRKIIHVDMDALYLLGSQPMKPDISILLKPDILILQLHLATPR